MRIGVESEAITICYNKHSHTHSTYTRASVGFVFAKRQCAECWLCCSSAQIVGCFAPRVFIAFRIIFQYQLSFSVVSPHLYFFALMSMRDCCMRCSKSNWFCILFIQYVLATRCTSSTWVIRLFSFRLSRSLAHFFLSYAHRICGGKGF